jgi:hypothetical protein
MNSRIRRIAVLAPLSALVAVPALAAEPVASSRYAGTTSQSGGLRFEFSTSADGRRAERLVAQFKTPKCATSRNGTQGSLRPASFTIAGGHFIKHGTEKARLRAAGGFKGGTQVERYRITGRFPDADTAKGTLKVTVEIRDKTGKPVDRCTSPRPITWTADRLGVAPGGEGG